MPTHKIEPDDDEVVIYAHKPAARAAPPERPGKRRRTGSVGRVRTPPTFLDLFRSGKPGLIRAMLAPFLPADLVALCSASQTVKKILQPASSEDIWKCSQANMPGPPVPSRPSSMDEKEWTTLLFVKKCQHCGKATTRDIDWGLRLRFCIACQFEHVKGSRYPAALPDVSHDVLRLVPCSGTAGQSAKNFWVPEITSVHRELTRLDAMVERGDTDATELRQKFVQKRKDHVQEVLNLMPAGQQWEKAYKDAQAAGVGASKTEVRRRVVARLVALGYRADDIEEELPARFSKGITSGSEAAWTLFVKKIQPKLDERRRTLSIKVARLHEHYRQFLGVYVPDDWETLVPFGDITSIPEVRSRLKDADEDEIGALAKSLTSVVARWRTRVEQQLLDLLPGRPADAASLRLATAIFLRGDDPTPLTYPQMLLGSHLRADEAGPLPYATKDGPWTADGLRHAAMSVHIVKEYCRLSGLEFEDATVAMLDGSPMRLECSRCNDEWPLVLTWRHAIEHAIRHHLQEGQPLPDNLWRASSVATERQAQRLDEDAEVWVCSLCPAASQVSRSTVDVRTHLRQRHRDAEVIKGQTYRRSLAAPTQRPMTTLATHVLSEDRGDTEVSWNCRHCVYEGDQSSVISHLKKEHAIDLRRPISQRLQTMPPLRIPATPRLPEAEAGPSQMRNTTPASSRRTFQNAPPSSSSKRSRDASIAAVSEDDIPILALKRARTASSTRASKISEPLPVEPVKKEVIALDDSSSSDSDDDPTSSTVRTHGRSKTATTARGGSLIPTKRQVPEYGVPPSTAKKRAVSSSTSSVVKGKQTAETIDLTFSDPPLPHHTPPRTVRDSLSTSLDGLDSSGTLSEDSSPTGECDSGEDETSSSEDAIDTSGLLHAEQAPPVAAVSPHIRLQPLPPIAAVPQHIRFDNKRSEPRTPVQPPTTSQLPKRPGFVCKHCKDSVQRFKHAGIMQHLAVSHGIVAPTKKTDYEFRNAAAPEPVADRVYMCKVCHMSLRQFDWTALTAHMATRHRLVDPRAGQHYTETAPREKTADPSLIRRQRYICRVCPAADKPRLLTMHGLKQHLFMVHSIEKMIYRQNFDKLKQPASEGVAPLAGDVDHRGSAEADVDSEDTDDASSAQEPGDSDAEGLSESGGEVAESRQDDDPANVPNIASQKRLSHVEAGASIQVYLSEHNLGPIENYVYSCGPCSQLPDQKRRHYRLPSVLDHLASCHSIRRPRLHEDFQVVPRKARGFRYECLLCCKPRDRDKRFDKNGMDCHLKARHGLKLDESNFWACARDTFSDSQ